MPERINFTQQALARVTCPEGRDRIYVYDLKRRGLCLCITCNGSRSFYLYRKLNGRPERIRLGSYPPMTIDQARDAADQVQGDIAKGLNPAEERRTARGEMTIDELFTRYLEDYAKLHKRSWEDDEKQFKRYLAGWKNKRLSDVKRHDVQQLHADIGRHHGHYCANRLVALLGKLFAFAADVGFTGMNPARGIKRFRELSRERFLQSDEMPRFLKALDKHPDKLIADFFRVCLFTGARRSNVQSMAWSDVNFGRRTWTIPAEQSKAGNSMVLYLSDEAMKALRRRWAQRIQDNGFVFPSHGKSGHLEEPKAAWRQVLARAKIADLRLHDLRRTYGSWLASGGASLPMIGKALGHRSTASTAVYSRLSIEPIKGMIDAAAAAMTAKPAAKPRNEQQRKGA